MQINPELLAELIDRHWGPLVVWVGRCGESAEDVVQQAFVALAAKQPLPDDPVAWLYTVARNRAINARKQQERRQKRQHRAAKPEGVDLPVESSSEAAELLELLNQLSDQLHEIVVARIWGGFSFEEIATLVGSSKATVWRQFETALTTLREVYGVTCETET